MYILMPGTTEPRYNWIDVTESFRDSSAGKEQYNYIVQSWMVAFPYTIHCTYDNVKYDIWQTKFIPRPKCIMDIKAPSGIIINKVWLLDFDLR
jgi:hypothetical protein